MKVIIIMGSDKDMEPAKKMRQFIEKFSVEVEMRIASAHKTPLKVIKILDENRNENVVFITIAGKSNALSAFVDANTTKPVIACPALKNDKFDMDVFSSLSMPGGVAPMVVLDPENAALAGLKIFALNNNELMKKINDFHEGLKKGIEKKDKELEDG